MRKITIATDDKTGHQAMYVDGELKESDTSLYASQVADYTDGEPVLIENVDAYLPDHETFFPDTLQELEEINAMSASERE